MFLLNGDVLEEIESLKTLRRYVSMYSQPLKSTKFNFRIGGKYLHRRNRSKLSCRYSLLLNEEEFGFGSGGRQFR